MPISAAYASAAAYRSRTGKTGTVDDALIDEVLKSVSRLIDRETGRFFTQDAAAMARIYDGSRAVPAKIGADDLNLFRRTVVAVGEGTRLYIDDIASLAGLIIKVDLNADFLYIGADETLTKDTHYFIGPPNAALDAEPHPFRFLDIVPGNGRLARWPDQSRSVQVTAVFGWPAIPGAIKEATVLVTREVLDIHKSGFTAALQNIDDVINLSPQAFSIIQRIKREYGLHAEWFA